MKGGNLKMVTYKTKEKWASITEAGNNGRKYGYFVEMGNYGKNYSFKKFKTKARAIAYAKAYLKN